MEVAQPLLNTSKADTTYGDFALIPSGLLQRQAVGGCSAKAEGDVQERNDTCSSLQVVQITC